MEQHGDHITLLKVRRGEALTRQDLEELERILIEQEVVDDTALAGLAEDGGLGRFLRSLTGLDRAAAKEAFGTFVAQHQLNADQTEFLDLIVDSLTENGFVDPATFYKSAFTDFDDMGIAGVFDRKQAQEIIRIVQTLNDAVAAGVAVAVSRFSKPHSISLSGHTGNQVTNRQGRRVRSKTRWLPDAACVSGCSRVHVPEGMPGRTRDLAEQGQQEGHGFRGV